MNIHIKLSLAFLIVACCSCSSKLPETLIEGGYDEQEMEAAIAQARSEVDSFLAILSAGDGTDFAVKAAIEDNGEIEHFWITEIVYHDGEFEGVISNDPGIVGNVKVGDKWTVKKSEISDWMFMRDGKIHGNFTLRPLLKTMSEEEAAEIRPMLADP
jgi:uncharacterized protein YegJ (DUF2314 family)